MRHSWQMEIQAALDILESGNATPSDANSAADSAAKLRTVLRSCEKDTHPRACLRSSLRHDY